MGIPSDFRGNRWHSSIRNIPDVVGMVQKAREDGRRKAMKRVCGALVGLVVFVAAPETVRAINGGIIFSPSLGGRKTVLAQAPSITPPSGASGNFNYNQQGGVTNQTYINKAPQKLTFSDALGAELLAKLPKDKPINLMVVGSNSDASVGAQIADFLTANGYKVQISRIGILVPPPDHPLTWVAASSSLIVAASAQ
jgi:hypothetical protein